MPTGYIYVGWVLRRGMICAGTQRALRVLCGTLLQVYDRNHCNRSPTCPLSPQGNCRCASHATDPWTRPVPHAQAGKLGPGCTLDRTAFPACVAKWVSPINPPQKPEWTAVAFINIGENTTEAEMNLNELHMDPSVQWELEDVWTGKSEGMITGSDTKSFSLRPHASVFIKAVPHTLQAVDLPKLHPLPLE